MVSDGKAGSPKAGLDHHELVIFLKVIRVDGYLIFDTSMLISRKTFFISMITYIITVTLVRLSILLTLRRIFNVEPFKMITTILGTVTTAWGVLIVLANIFQCTPLMDAFDPDVVMTSSKSCIDLQAMFYATLGTGFTIDLIILILPLHIIWRLRLSTRQKFEVTAILSLGGL